MNKERRKVINNIINILDDLKQRLSNVMDEEQEAFDNLPEGLQYSLRGEAMEDAVNSMSEAIDSLDDAISSLEEVT